ncbi:TIGR02996 domain-containing protein [Nannocystaceae bacterium ST9]
MDLDGLAQACTTGDLTPFAAARQLGWTLDDASRQALLHALADTNFHRSYSYGVSAFTLAQAIGLICEAATNASGVAALEQVRALKLGKEVAIAFRDDTHVHFGVRYASNLPMTPGHLWTELKPWFKQLERNRKQLAVWAARAKGIVSVPRVIVAARPTDVDAEARGDELLAAVVARPDDVAARLVYADWLLARNDARGELISLCEQRRSSGSATMDARIEELERDYADRIAGEVAELARSYTLGRGFVERITMAAETFAKHGARLLARHPIQRLDLEPVNARALARLAKADALRGLKVLHLSQIIGKTRPMPFDELCASTRLDALERLEVWTWVSEGDPEAAFAGLRAPRMTSLRLYQVDSSPKILAGLAANPELRLRRLSVGLRERRKWPSVFASPGFERLQSLELDIHGADAIELLDHPNLPELESLDLDDDIPIDRLALPTLRRLRLGEVELDADAFTHLLKRHPNLHSLRIWRLQGLDLDRAIDLALALPSDHPLTTLALPISDPEQIARLETRFQSEEPR